MQHVLVQQLKKGSEVLVVVKERILTTNPCSVTQTRKEHCALQGVLSLIGMLGSSVKVGPIACVCVCVWLCCFL